MDSSTTRSDFVTVIAWILIIFSIFSMLGVIYQNIITNLVVSNLITDSLIDVPKDLFGLFRVFFVLLIFAPAALLFLSIQFLQRKNWARLLIILAAIATLAGTVIVTLGFLYASFSGLSILDTFARNTLPAHFKPLLRITFIYLTLISGGFIGVFGWIVKKLKSDEIKDEFI